MYESAYLDQLAERLTACANDEYMAKSDLKRAQKAFDRAQKHLEDAKIELNRAHAEVRKTLEEYGTEVRRYE